MGGVGAAGAVRATGVVRAMGATLAAGAVGAAGATESVGAVGTTGAMGVVGAAGATGAMGAAGAMLAAGGASRHIANMAFYFDSTKLFLKGIYFYSNVYSNIRLKISAVSRSYMYSLTTSLRYMHCRVT